VLNHTVNTQVEVAALYPLTDFLQGIMVSILFFKPLSKQVMGTAIIKKLSNIFVYPFYSIDYYRKIAYQQTGSGILHIVILVALVSIPLSIVTSEKYSTSKILQDEVIMETIHQLPNLNFKNGQISIQESTPFRIYDKNKNIIGIVDTRTDQADLYSEIQTLKLLITKNKALFYFDDHQKFTFHFIEWRKYNSTHTSEDFILLLTVMKITEIIMFVYPMIFFGTFFIFFMLGLLSAYKDKELILLDLDFKARLRVFWLCITAPLIIFPVADFLLGYELSIMVILLPLAYGYRYYFVNALREHKQQ
jgi:hypothetical protein